MVRMYCSVCYLELRQEYDPFITCADCEDHFHYDCIDPEVLGTFYKAMVDQVRWYCRNCVDDSDSTREELQKFVCSVPTNHLRPPKMEEAAQALDVQGPSMETLDERGEIHENRTPKWTEVEVEEEKNTEKELVQIEGEKEDEPKINPGNADD